MIKIKYKGSVHVWLLTQAYICSISSKQAYICSIFSKHKFNTKTGGKNAYLRIISFEIY